MAPLTRKRKAEIEAAEAETTNISKRVRLDRVPKGPQSPERIRPFQRTDPFRPLSPRPKEVRTRKLSYPVKLWKLNPKTVEPPRPLPIVFFTEPMENPMNQLSAKSRSSHDVDTILAMKSLYEHAHKYGAVALPTKDTLESWLEQNKDKFIQARKSQSNARQPQPPVQRNNNAPRHADPMIAALPEVPTMEHPAVRRRLTAATILRRSAKSACRTASRLVRATRHHIATALEATAHLVRGVEGPAPEVEFLRDIEDQEAEDSARRTAVLEAVQAGEAEPLRVRPIAPPLDTRFFHPNGQLQTVYKYLTAQIPLPRQWVDWAVNNGIYTVEGRGDIREPGCYVAEDTFDYDHLHLAIHRGSFRTGRREIDSFPEHWPIAGGLRDNYTLDLNLHRFTGHSTKRIEGPAELEQGDTGNRTQLAVAEDLEPEPQVLSEPATSGGLASEPSCIADSSPTPSRMPVTSLAPELSPHILPSSRGISQLGTYSPPAQRSVALAEPAATPPPSDEPTDVGLSPILEVSETPLGGLAPNKKRVRFVLPDTPGAYPDWPASSSPRSPSPYPTPTPISRRDLWRQENDVSASPAMFGLPEDFYDTSSEGFPSPILNPTTARRARTTADEEAEYDKDEDGEIPLPETPPPPPRPFTPTPSPGGTFGLPDDFYDGSDSDSNYNSSGPADTSMLEGASFGSELEEKSPTTERQHQSQEYLRQARAALRGEIQDTGSQRRIASPRSRQWS
ncbi:hypothetical protein GGS23DRAFT_621021 [Durotheca rogersii]|uniref:uncharacterized protein n=1 Tax=Durotheca rogersii TaxID=419775 RepID=UPI00221EC9B1|nr:uncharacterized protein GGS23DRAFT_621021 [Durotheca rogersii]KAI5863372.1 hypothetical protein GGS23DRAFT_621021 [Durotheca rogersii]